MTEQAGTTHAPGNVPDGMPTDERVLRFFGVRGERVDEPGPRGDFWRLVRLFAGLCDDPGFDPAALAAAFDGDELEEAEVVAVGMLRWLESFVAAATERRAA